MNYFIIDAEDIKIFKKRLESLNLPSEETNALSVVFDKAIQHIDLVRSDQYLLQEFYSTVIKYLDYLYTKPQPLKNNDLFFWKTLKSMYVEFLGFSLSSKLSRGWLRLSIPVNYDESERINNEYENFIEFLEKKYGK